MATLKASEQGKERIRQARNDRGWPVDDSRWLVEASEILEPHRNWEVESLLFANGVSEGTWKAFLYRQRGIDTKVFKAYCQVLGLSWEEIREVSNKSLVNQGNSDWQKICREMLEAQKQNLRRQVTQMGFELNVHVPLGLVDRKQQSRRSSDFSLPPEQGSSFFQLSDEEIIETYEHDEFLEQVIQQGQSKKSQGKRIAIIGEPGAGKTTLLEAIAFCQNLPDLPIWISLGSLGEKSLEEYLCQKWLKDALKTSDVTQQQKELENLFKSGEVLLLLDGVDEMPAPSPVEALAKIREQLTGWVADARVVLTCRVNVWDATVNTLQGFDTYRTLEFSYGDGNKPDQVREFICQWFFKAEKPELGEPLREKLDEDRHQRIRDLVKNPLRLSLLCQSWYFCQGNLPETKAALYEQFTRAFYDWKEEHFPTTPTKRKELNAALGLLAREAIDKEKSRFGIRESFAIDVMGEDLFKLATEKLNWVVEVYKDVETGKPVYAFFHPTFQEYFAACAIDDWGYFLNHVPHNPKEGIYRIFDAQWKEVFLLWLGRDDVPKQQKENSIETLVNFKDRCWDFYRYRAFFLASAGIIEFKNYPFADAIEFQLFMWSCGYTNVEEAEQSEAIAPIKNAARTVLKETNSSRAIEFMADLLQQYASEDEYNNLEDRYWLEIACYFLTIDPSNQNALNVLEKLMCNSQYEGISGGAAIGLALNNERNSNAVNTLIRLAHDCQKILLRLLFTSVLMKIEVGNQKVLAILQRDPLNKDTAEQLTKIVEKDNGSIEQEDILEKYRFIFQLGQMPAGNSKAVFVLIRWMCSSQNEDIRWVAASSLKRILRDDLFSIAVSVLKNCLQHEFYTKNDCDLYEWCYEVLWHCAQNMPYPDFYQAWNSQSSTISALENQFTNIATQLQPTDKTYPIAIDTQTLKLETNTIAIAQKLCTKIYRKAGYSEIPTVIDAAQLQQYIPCIQEKLQKPNLALILHSCEPNEHLINFCYSLADRDIGIYISLITSQPIEQPLKGFLTNQDNLLSAIQNWIDELG
jgi:hypothetical protein